MSYTTKNYTTDGGDTTVIGGKLVFEEGASVEGLPSAVILDFKGIDVNDAIGEPLDVSEVISMDDFRIASSGERPVLIKGLMFNDNEIGVQGVATMIGEGIMAMAPFNGNRPSAMIVAIGSLLLFPKDDHVMLCISIIPLFEPDEVTGVSLSTNNLTLTEGDTAELYAYLSYSGAPNTDVYWSSNDESVVTLDAESGQPIDCNTPATVQAIGVGTATITVTTSDGGYTDICEVTVESAEPEMSPDPGPEDNPEEE